MEVIFKFWYWLSDLSVISSFLPHMLTSVPIDLRSMQFVVPILDFFSYCQPYIQHSIPQSRFDLLNFLKVSVFLCLQPTQIHLYILCYNITPVEIPCKISTSLRIVLLECLYMFGEKTYFFLWHLQLLCTRSFPFLTVVYVHFYI